MAARPDSDSPAAAPPAPTGPDEPLLVWPEERDFSERQQRALLRLAATLRRAVTACVDVDGDASALERLADRTDETTRALEQAASGKPIPLMAHYAEQPDPTGMLPYSPIMGRANPIAPPLRLAIEGDRAIGVVTLGSVYQGAPGIAHGGVVASIFDEVLAFSTILGGGPGPTGELRVQYRKPTPLWRELRFEAWVEELRERRTLARARCMAGDVLCAEATGWFVRVQMSASMESWTDPFE